MSEQYKKALKTHADLVAKAKNGDRAALADKAKAMSEVRAIEREAAREGRSLTAGESTPSKRSLQEAYVRSFDEKTVVNVRGENTTLRSYHAKRLLGAR